MKYQNKVVNSTHNYSPLKASEANIVANSQCLSVLSTKELEIQLKPCVSQSLCESVLSRADTCDDSSEVRSLMDFIENATDVNTQICMIKKPAPFKRLVFISKLEDGSLATNKQFMDLNADHIINDDMESSIYTLSAGNISRKIQKNAKVLRSKLRAAMRKTACKRSMMQDSVLTEDLF